jgi:hypothetical protein
MEQQMMVAYHRDVNDAVCKLLASRLRQAACYKTTSCWASRTLRLHMQAAAIIYIA